MLIWGQRKLKNLRKKKQDRLFCCKLVCLTYLDKGVCIYSKIGMSGVNAYLTYVTCDRFLR
jgi:hypothetical protein